MPLTAVGAAALGHLQGPRPWAAGRRPKCAGAEACEQGQQAAAGAGCEACCDKAQLEGVGGV